MGKTVLSLQLAVASGDESNCAAFLGSQIRGDRWRILVALAAEILAQDERAREGSAVVLVTGSASAARVLQDLKAGN